MEIEVFLDWLVNLVDSFFLAYLIVFGGIILIVGGLYVKDKLEHSKMTPMIINSVMIFAMPFILDNIQFPGQMTPDSMYMITSMSYWLHTLTPFILLAVWGLWGFTTLFSKES